MGASQVVGDAGMIGFEKCYCICSVVYQLYIVIDLPKDCGEVFSRGQKFSSLYAIKPYESETFLVNCEFTEGKNKAYFHSYISEFFKTARGVSLSAKKTD